MDKQAKIYIAGHNGMVGSAIMRGLMQRGYANILLRSRQQLNLVDQSAVSAFLREEAPEYIFLAAAKVGGIYANSQFPVDFIYQNLMIEANVLNAAHAAKVQRLLFLGSSCIYPRDCAQPIREEYLLTGPLEASNEPYAIAKIAGIKLCESFNRQHGRQYLSLMPTNLYGPNDNYDLTSSHVLPALIRKAHSAKLRGEPELVIWGSGRPRREFLHVDDLADACIFAMENESMTTGLYNVGVGKDLTIKELAVAVMETVGYEGAIRFDASKPDGTPRKLLDISAMTRLGWTPKRTLREGLRETYQAYLREHNAW